MIQLEDNPRLHTFSVEAMYTTVSLRLACANAKQAQEAASACFIQLEEIEAAISRFRPDSDVSCINQLKPGESLLISEMAYACLLQALDLQAITAGLFDVTLGAHTWPEGFESRGAGADDGGRIEVAPDQPLVTCRAPGRQIDLGGIGKGFALDQLAETLRAHRIDSALLCAGASSILALGPQPWPIVLTGDTQKVQIELRAGALSASGFGIQGTHVVHPDLPDEEVPYLFKRVWLTAPMAAMADGCSTACLLMDDDEIESFAGIQGDGMTIYAEDYDDLVIRKINSGE